MGHFLCSGPYLIVIAIKLKVFKFNAEWKRMEMSGDFAFNGGNRFASCTQPVLCGKFFNPKKAKVGLC